MNYSCRGNRSKCRYMVLSQLTFFNTIELVHGMRLKRITPDWNELDIYIQITPRFKTKHFKLLRLTRIFELVFISFHIRLQTINHSIAEWHRTAFIDADIVSQIHHEQLAVANNVHSPLVGWLALDLYLEITYNPHCVCSLLTKL